MKQNLSRGFTLIEIIVVVAIISILTAVAFAVVASAREKGQDSRIIANVAQIPILANAYYDANGSTYSELSACLRGFLSYCKGGIGNAVAALREDTAQAGSFVTAISTEYVPTREYYCAKAPLASNPNKFICADSTGKLKIVNDTRCRVTDQSVSFVLC
jgi:prepilin-type N-terminal cleavage/methylation domain-containing protein